jgi:TATA-binding protein-associated factor Taf7
MRKKLYLLLFLLSLAPLAVGQEITPALEGNIAPSDAYDCTIVALDTVDESSLTTAERIAQMDASLLDSIDKHDNCIDQVVSDNAAGGSGAGLGGTGGEGLDGADGDNLDAEESEGENSGGNNNDQSENATEQANSEDTTNKQRNNENQTDGNGAKNRDIAVKDNDSAVCRLLKDELKIETDPKKRAELKEIYNSYNCRG